MVAIRLICAVPSSDWSSSWHAVEFEMKNKMESSFTRLLCFAICIGLCYYEIPAEASKSVLYCAYCVFTVLRSNEKCFTKLLFGWIVFASTCNPGCKKCVFKDTQTGHVCKSCVSMTVIGIRLLEIDDLKMLCQYSPTSLPCVAARSYGMNH